MNQFIDYFRKNFVYTTASVVIFLVLLTLVFTGIFITDKPVNLKPTAKPTTLPSVSPEKSYDYGPAAGSSYQTHTKTDEEFFQRKKILAQLNRKLPYKGTNFTLEYRISDSSYTLSYPPKVADEANKEFDAFLKQNNIADRSWFTTLRENVK